ncbi:MAG: glycosyltransferase [Boseongicola sp.]|nr:glycosyltransferase [Boseongicola sp.]
MAEYLLPAFAVLLAASLAPKWSPDRRWFSTALAAGYAFLLIRYLFWRITETVLPVEMPSTVGIVVWLIFVIESLVWLEGANLILVILNRTDRTLQADLNETKSRGTAPENLPDVDVFIATYNEPLEVLEKTIAGALALDWAGERLHVFVLDDGRRDWLHEYCKARGVVHLTRSDNQHAKAGNINAALKRTNSPFILVLDADFVPLRSMLHRAMGFFEDPSVGIVQMPHHFFNSDPVQVNLNLEVAMPDEQRLFFDVIQPGRDGLGCAFCCGSNGIIRREAIREIGGRMPTDSVTEDMLLTLAMFRKGYVTRYLNERLAIGLAPENLQSYFVQRSRWAQGAIQTMFLRNGPFGPGLSLRQRLLFVPSHWISMSLCQPLVVSVPAFFLLTGIPPLINVSTAAIFYFQVPVVLASMMLMLHLAAGKFAPLSAAAQSLLQALRVAPTVLATLIKPNGHSFNVTPKGKAARGSAADLFVLRVSMGLFLLTGLGLLLNSNASTRMIANADLLPIVSFWAIFNMIILLLVAAMAIPRLQLRAEERFELSQKCRLTTERELVGGVLVNASMSGCLVRVNDVPGVERLTQGDWVGVEFSDVGLIAGRIARCVDLDVGSSTFGIVFQLESGEKRDRLIQKLFCEDLPLTTAHTEKRTLSLLLLLRALRPLKEMSAEAPRWEIELGALSTPAWLRERLSYSDRAELGTTDWAAELKDDSADAPINIERSARVRIHNQSMTTAAKAHADRKTFGHLS